MSHDIELLISDLLAYSTTYPQDIESRLMLAQLYDVTKQNEKAVNCYHHILEIDPYHAQAHFEIAVSNLKRYLEKKEVLILWLISLLINT